MEKMKQYSLSEMEDRYIGKIGTPQRDKYEYELRMKLLSLKADIRFNAQLCKFALRKKALRKFA